MNYAVIEYTPGYLPENDDPPVFDQYSEALNYLLAERQRLFDDEWGYEEEELPASAMPDLIFMLDVGEVENGGFIYYDTRKMHDLGRIVEIVLLEE